MPNLETDLRARRRNAELRIFHCLGWNKLGSLLASGDKYGQLVIWSPNTKTPRQSIETWGGTVKEVKFIHGYADRFLISCSNVQLKVTDLVKKSPILDSFTTGVHCLMNHQSEPNLILLCNNDSIEQIDIRERVKHTNRILKFKNLDICSAINPARSELLAVGTQNYIKIFDRRLIGRKDSDLTLCKTFVLNQAYEYPRHQIENFTFSQDGSEILANYCDGVVHLFNLNDSPRQSKFYNDLRNDNRCQEYSRHAKFFGTKDEYILAASKNELHIYNKHTSDLVHVVKKGSIDFSTSEFKKRNSMLAAINNQDQIVLLVFDPRANYFSTHVTLERTM